MSKKQLFTLEFPVRCSPTILFEFLATPAGLQEWFADKVDEWENVYSFSWNGGTPDKADVVDKEEDKFIRFPLGSIAIRTNISNSVSKRQRSPTRRSW